MLFNILLAIIISSISLVILVQTKNLSTRKDDILPIYLKNIIFLIIQPQRQKKFTKVQFLTSVGYLV